MKYSYIICGIALLSSFPVQQVFAQNVVECSTNGLGTTLNFIYSSEKAKWIVDATRSFNASKIQIGGKTVCVNAYADNSNSVADEAIGSAKAKLANSDQVYQSANFKKYAQVSGWDLASPASDIYISKANADFKAQTGKGDVFLNSTPLVSSPVVIAMWEDVAKSFGYPQKDITWAQIRERAEKDKNFRFGQTQPRSSNSGLSALLAQFYAANFENTKKNIVRLSKAEMTVPANQTFVQTIQKSVVHYGESTGFFQKTLVKNGPSYLSAAVLYENLVIEAQNEVLKNGFPRLLAIIPKDGTFNSTHPVAIVRGTSDEKKKAGEKFIAFLTSQSQQQAAVAAGFRPGADEDGNLKLNASLQTIYGKVLKDIKYLTTPDGETINEALRAFANGVKKPAHLAIVLDHSGSMSERGRMINARDGAIGIVKSLTVNDLVTLFQFDSRADLLIFKNLPANVTSGTSPLLDERTKNLINGVIGQIAPAGGTAIRDSVYQAASAICRDPNSANGRIRGIILLTDGDDTGSRMDSNNLFTGLASLKTTTGEPCQIPVFTVGYEVSEASEASQLLRKISSITKGQYFSGNQDTVVQILKYLADFM